LSRSKTTVNDIIESANDNRKRQHSPLVATVEPEQERLENIFSRSPSKTDWVEEMLTGGSQYEIEKMEPVSEEYLKKIFPMADAAVMKDPLTQTDKQRIHDNIRRDPASAIAPLTFTYFLLGPDNTITLGLNRKYATEERKKNAMAVIQSNEKYLDIIEDIMNRDEDMEIQTRKMQLIFQGSCFGRSVMIRQYDKRNLPCRYIPLSPTRLGRAWVDRHSWEFLGVEYLDYSKDRRILLAKDVIHYECDDMMITPRSRFYGMSMAESLMAIGERNRVINEIAIPEITRKHWAPILLVKVNTGSLTKINEIRNIFSMPGKTQVYNDAIEVTEVTLNHDLEKLHTALENGNQDIFRRWTVPQGIGWPEDPNHATMENSLLAWYNGILAFRRAHLDGVMWLQHYKGQLKQILKEEYLFGDMPSDPNLLGDYIIQRAAKPLNDELPFRIVTEFNNIKTTGFLELSQALLGWVQANIITKAIALKEGGLGQYVDDMAEEDQKKVTLAGDMLSQEQNLQPQPGQGPAPSLTPKDSTLPIPQP